MPLLYMPSRALASLRETCVVTFIASLEKDGRLSEVRENRDVIVRLLFNYDVAVSHAVWGGEVDLDEIGTWIDEAVENIFNV
jgi:hypothetical protein